jgi:predicted RNA-binding Zn-ribbon protein involved in translation (DUF1610 family)
MMPADNQSAGTIACPMCGNNQDKATATLGQLGNMIHYRCRHCGWDWHELAQVDYRTILED